MRYFFVIRTHSIGLYGEPFCFGYCIIDEIGIEYEKGYIECDIEKAKGLESDYEWVCKNVVPMLPKMEEKMIVNDPDELCDILWKIWIESRSKYKDIYCAAYCCYPVESGIFRRCVSKNIEEREEKAPYPFIEIATVQLLAGHDSLLSRDKKEEEKPIYNPIKDARYASNLLVEALEKIKNISKNKMELIPTNNDIIFDNYSDFFGIDTKTVGLYGQVYDFGYVNINKTGNTEKGSFRSWCPIKNTDGLEKDKILRLKTLENFPSALDRCNPNDILNDVWNLLLLLNNNNSLLISFCPYPVETGLLQSCISLDLENRQFMGPYPLHDTATALFLCNLDPLSDFDRKPNELPRYNPINGARQAARLFLECSKTIKSICT